MSVYKFIAHSKTAINIALEYGWLPGACYTNIRNVRDYNMLGFLDINWRNYDFDKHLYIAEKTKPLLTVAQDIVNINLLDEIIGQGYSLLRHSRHVIIVPKDIRLVGHLEKVIPEHFMFGYSVPTRYAGTLIPPEEFKRPVHLLGGRPDIQRKLAEKMNVFSFDCNRFTLDASYGDYFDGVCFKRHPIGGYKQCITDSVYNINMLWENYKLEGR